MDIYIYIINIYIHRYLQILYIHHRFAVWQYLLITAAFCWNMRKTYEGHLFSIPLQSGQRWTTALQMKEQAQSDAFSAEDAFQNEFLAPWTLPFLTFLDPSFMRLNERAKGELEGRQVSQYFSPYAVLAEVSVSGQLDAVGQTRHMCADV